MKKRNSIIIGIIGMISIVSCQPQSELDELIAQKSKLKSELTNIEEKIRAKDTTQVEFLPLVVVDEITNDRFEHRVNVQGEVRTDEEIMINAEANGIVVALNVREGDYVKKGQALAEIDSQVLAGNVGELETSIEFAEYTYQKQQELFDRGVGTEFELKQSKNQLNSLKSQLNTLKTQKSKYTVTAPFNGYIDEIMVRRGEMAGAQMPLLRLVNNTNMRISADISEFYYTKINVGTPIRVFIPTIDAHFNLAVTSVGTFIHPTNRTFRIQADIDEHERLIPNMLAEVNVTDLVLDSVYIVPATALIKSQENKDFIFVLNESNDYPTVEYVEVEILSRYKGLAAIEPLDKDISAIRNVVVQGARGVTNGDRVRIQ